MSPKSASTLGAVDWWDSRLNVDTSAGKWTGTLHGTEMQPFGKTFPTYDALGKKFAFTPGQALRTAFSSTYRSIFAGNCTIVLDANYQGGTRIFAAGRQSSYNGISYGQLLAVGDSTQLVVQNFDVSSSNASVTGGNIYQRCLLVLRKVGTTVQALYITPSGVVTAGAVSGVGPDIQDIEFLGIGSTHSSDAQGATMGVYGTGFFPSALSNQDLIDLYEYQNQPIAGDILAFWDVAQGVNAGARTWTDKVNSVVLSAAPGEFPTSTTVGGKTFLRFGAGQRVKTASVAAITSAISSDCTILVLGRVLSGTRILNTFNTSDPSTTSYVSALAMTRTPAQNLSVGHYDTEGVSEALPSGQELALPGALSLHGIRKSGTTIEALINKQKSGTMSVTNVTDADALLVGDPFTSSDGATMDIQQVLVLYGAVSDSDIAAKFAAYRPTNSPSDMGASIWLDPSQGVASTSWTDRISGTVFSRSVGSASLAGTTVDGLSCVRLQNVVLDSPAGGTPASAWNSSTSVVMYANRGAPAGDYLAHGVMATNGYVRGVMGTASGATVYDSQWTQTPYWEYQYSGTLDYGVVRDIAISKISGGIEYGMWNGNPVSNTGAPENTNASALLRVNGNPGGTTQDADYHAVVFFPSGLQPSEIEDVVSYLGLIRIRAALRGSTAVDANLTSVLTGLSGALTGSSTVASMLAIAAVWDQSFTGSSTLTADAKVLPEQITATLSGGSTISATGSVQPYWVSATLGANSTLTSSGQVQFAASGTLAGSSSMGANASVRRLKIRSQARHNTQVGASQTYDDTLLPGSTLQSGATTIQDDLNSLRSQIKRILSGSAPGHWYDDLAISGGMQRSIAGLSESLNTVETQTILYPVSVLTDITVPSAQNFVILSASSAETPSGTVAVNAGSAGVVVAKSSSTGSAFGAHELTVQAGPDALHPKNLSVVRDSVTKEVITSGGYDVYALLQVEGSGSNGDTLDDLNTRGKLSFVRQNASGVSFEAVPSADIAGKSINYIYNLRVPLSSIPEASFLHRAAFVDRVAGTDVTLDWAVDHQIGPVTQARDVAWRVASEATLIFGNSDGSRALLGVYPRIVGDLIEINADHLTITHTETATFSHGVRVDTTGVGITLDAGEVTSDGDLSLASSAAGSVVVRSAAEILLTDGNRTASTWTSPSGIKLSDTTAEWDAYRTQFGEVSILQAFSALASSSIRHKGSAKVTSPVSAGGNVGGVNLDSTLPAYSASDFQAYVDVYLNGEILQSGVGRDVYPGVDPSSGDLKFSFDLSVGDVLTLIVNQLP